MPRTCPPAYCLHKASGQAVVRLNGKDYYLGRYGSTESREAYHRTLAEWEANNRKPVLPTAPSVSGVSINEVILAFWEHAQRYYRAPVEGRESRELGEFRYALRPLRELYGETPATTFGPLRLKAVREWMIAAGWCRRVVNMRMTRVKHVFKWATENELIPATVFYGLQAVRGLAYGRTEVRETEPVRPVSEDCINAAITDLQPTVAAMVKLQLLTGMRPGEVCSLRLCDIDRSGSIWLYRPQRHKNTWRGHPRTVALGPEAQAVLEPFLAVDPHIHVFSPKRSLDQYRVELRKARRTKVQPSQRHRRKRLPKVVPREYYTVDSYRRAIARACKKAGIAVWHPNQLRHTAATRIQREFGIDAARAVLGRRTPIITAVYAEVDATKASEVMSKIG